MNYSTAEIGTHSELFAALSLIANSYKVASPLTVEPYDFVFYDESEGVWLKAQVKTAYSRNDRMNPAIVVFARKKNGNPYSLDEVDVFLTVYDGSVYMFPNRGQQEYWATPSNIDRKWRRLDHKLDR